ncbi:hypothetical protein BJ166DRAFT_195859 [Pestalotiopsis sp. NC0098]|nr:hypothetical protein BJ166DRAFT_195859 [Pestalotiopsis sp. NC0098]
MDGANDLTLPRRKASVCHLYSNHEPALGRVKTVRVISSQLMPRVERRPFLRVGSTVIRGRIQVSPNPSQASFLPLYFPGPCSVRDFPRSPDGRIRRSWVMLHCGHDIPSQRCDPASISNGRPRVVKRSYVRLTARDRQLVAWVRIHRGRRGREELGKWCGRICECTPYLTFQFSQHFANTKTKGNLVAHQHEPKERHSCTVWVLPP